MTGYDYGFTNYTVMFSDINVYAVFQFHNLFVSILQQAMNTHGTFPLPSNCT